MDLKHLYGPLYTAGGSICNRNISTIIPGEDFAACISIDGNSITLHKFGHYAIIKKYYDVAVNSLGEDWKIVTFKGKAFHNINLEDDEICTLINYWMNVSLASKKILEAPLHKIKKEIKKIALLGY